MHRCAHVFSVRCTHILLHRLRKTALIVVSRAPLIRFGRTGSWFGIGGLGGLWYSTPSEGECSLPAQLLSLLFSEGPSCSTIIESGLRNDLWFCFRDPGSMIVALCPDPHEGDLVSCQDSFSEVSSLGSFRFPANQHKGVQASSAQDT